MTKYMKILFVGALSVAVAQPALANCGSLTPKRAAQPLHRRSLQSLG